MAKKSSKKKSTKSSKADGPKGKGSPKAPAEPGDAPEPAGAEGVPDPVEGDTTPLPHEGAPGVVTLPPASEMEDGRKVGAGEFGDQAPPEPDGAQGEASPTPRRVPALAVGIDTDTEPTPPLLIPPDAGAPDLTDHVRVELYRGAKVLRGIAHRDEAEDIRARHLANRKGRPQVVISPVAKPGDRVCCSPDSWHGVVEAIVEEDGVLVAHLRQGPNSDRRPLAECAVSRG